MHRGVPRGYRCHRAGTCLARRKGGVRMHQDFDHLLADHLLARERATRGREEVERDPAARAKRAAQSSDDGIARGGRVARGGGALLRAWFR
jgi:hypothetical protein